MTPDIFPMVLASDDCKALLGSIPRFYEFGEAVQGKQKPYAVWQLITGIPENYLGQLPDADDTRIQIDVYADTMLSAKVTSTAIRDAIEPYGYMVNFSVRPRDPTTRSYGYMLDFQFQTDR